MKQRLDRGRTSGCRALRLLLRTPGAHITQCLPRFQVLGAVRLLPMSAGHHQGQQVGGSQPCPTVQANTVATSVAKEVTPAQERLLRALSTDQNDLRPPSSPFHPPSKECAPPPKGGASSTKRALREVRFEAPATKHPATAPSPKRANPAPPAQVQQLSDGEHDPQESQSNPRFRPASSFSASKKVSSAIRPRSCP